MIAITATRKATETMIPTRVKNERSLLAWICPSALVTTSVERITGKADAPGIPSQDRELSEGCSQTRRAAGMHRRPAHHPTVPILLVAQRRHRIEPRRAERGDDPEHHAGERAADDRREDRAQRNFRRHRRRRGGEAPGEGADDEPGHRPDAGQRDRLDEELPEDRPLCRA